MRYEGLARRLGPDTIAKLEAAAPRRLAEAVYLRERHPVGALYLLGYVAESYLQAAYYRLIGYKLNTEITVEVRRRVIANAMQLRFMGRTPHNIAGWARLLIATRKRRGLGYSQQFEFRINDKATAIYGHWRPALRYRVTVPTPRELNAVQSSAEWFDQNYPLLWK